MIGIRVRSTSQIGSGRFFDYDSLLFPVYNLDYAIEFTNHYAEVIVDDIDEILNSELFSYYENKMVKEKIEIFIDEKLRLQR